MTPKTTKTFLKYTFAIFFVFSLTMFAFFQLFRIDTEIDVERVYNISNYTDMTEKMGKLLENGKGETVRIDTTVKELVHLKSNTDHIKIGRIYYQTFTFSSLRVQRLNQTPGSYIKVNEIPFLSLRKLINFINSANRTSYTSNNVQIEELLKIEKFVEKNGNTIEYDSKFYKIVIDCRIYLEPKCYEVTEDDLKDKPKLRELLEIAEKNGYAEGSAPSDEWRRTQDLVYKESGNLPLEYNGSCYRVRAIGAP